MRNSNTRKGARDDARRRMLSAAHANQPLTAETIISFIHADTHLIDDWAATTAAAAKRFDIKKK